MKERLVRARGARVGRVRVTSDLARAGLDVSAVDGVGRVVGSRGRSGGHSVEARGGGAVVGGEVGADGVDGACDGWREKEMGLIGSVIGTVIRERERGRESGWGGGPFRQSTDRIR